MRLKIIIDNISHDIDSTDPETLGRWIVEIFARYPNWTPATYCMVQAYPSTIWEPYPSEKFKVDWITDSRWLGQLGRVQTPRELLTQLTKWLDDYEANRD